MNPKLEKRKSRIHGYGLFAKEPIKKGEIITTDEDNFMTFSKKEYKRLPNKLKQFLNTYGYLYNNKIVMVVNDSRFINHSTSPNAINAMIAARDIKKNEEITEDYSDYSISKDMKHLRARR